MEARPNQAVERPKGKRQAGKPGAAVADDQAPAKTELAFIAGKIVSLSKKE